jgi:RHS repeat-associated protein
LLARSGDYSGGVFSQHDYYHADGLGNITYLADNTQSQAASYAYDPYGNLLSSAGTLATANTYRFSSREYVPTSGLYVYLYRFYNAGTERWLNQDPLGEQGGINLYRFVRGNPVNSVDPRGLVLRFAPSCPSEFENHWLDVMNLLSQSERGNELLQTANNVPYDIVITPVSEDGPSTEYSYDDDSPLTTLLSVQVNLDENDTIGATPGNQFLPPADEMPPDSLAGGAVVLAHELGHAAMNDNDEDPDNPGGDNVQANENPVRQDLGVPLRQNYHGNPIWLSPMF